MTARPMICAALIESASAPACSPRLASACEAAGLTLRGIRIDVERPADVTPLWAGADVILLPLYAKTASIHALSHLAQRPADVPLIAIGCADADESEGGVVEQGADDYIPDAQLTGPALARAIRSAITRASERRQFGQSLQTLGAALASREEQLDAALANLAQTRDALQASQLQLLQMEKMESVGRLAAGIAHEVKNPLAIISTGIDCLNQTAARENPMIDRILASMARAVKRADSVIRGLLDFSAPAALAAEPCDLNCVIRQALLLLDHELMRCNVTLTADLLDNLPPVSIDANKVEQVFLNLFINAIQAMPAGGSLAVRTRSQQLAALGHSMGDLRAERFRAGEVVVVAEVDDAGSGIAADQLSKVFDPFFTTKPTGKGTGLGLSVARTIVELHGGMLQLANRPEGGVRAMLILKACGENNHDNRDSCGADLQETRPDRGRRTGLHAHDGHGVAADRAI